MTKLLVSGRLGNAFWEIRSVALAAERKLYAVIVPVPFKAFGCIVDPISAAANPRSTPIAPPDSHDGRYYFMGMLARDVDLRSRAGGRTAAHQWTMRLGQAAPGKCPARSTGHAPTRRPAVRERLTVRGPP